MKQKVSANQLSLFDTAAASTNEIPVVEIAREYIIWYSNMSGRGEHVWAQLIGNGINIFAPRDLLIKGIAEPILFTYVDVKPMREKHHARLGKMIWNNKGWYEIEEIHWSLGNAPG